MTLDAVAELSAVYVMAVVMSASGYTLREDFAPGAGAPNAPNLMADR
ncbi:MAG: hypothetical protein KUL88_06075 [Rhizobium sp.]|nr:hypothetical protein [Rhizobium sp.]